MKHRLMFSFALAAALALPAIAQQSDQAPSDQPQATQQPSSQPAADTNSPMNMPDKQLEPLKPPEREGFWGRVNPFARKKYVQKNLQPIRDRENELDDLTASNSRMLKDVDSRATAGIQRADQHAALADQHAVDAGNRAQQANQTATAAGTQLQSVSQVVENLDQYQTANQVEIRFRPGATTLSKNAKDALDQLAQTMKDQKGYVVEVQGFTHSRGSVGIQQSQHLADSVVRYLVIEHQIPVFRIYELGLGNAELPATASTTAQGEETPAKPSHVSRVEVTLLKNSLDNLGQHAAQASSMSQPQ